MGMDPRETLDAALDAARDIAANATDNAAEMIYHAGEALKGDVSGGASGIAASAADIAATALAKGKEAIGR
ncbi:hypothetical protein [Nocardioides jejuensis]|uniref:Uncharacterized protein n=1 Tax=Nocardioides jejuensis TaxID=2502782 RepID=A0A4R1CDF3_9ACTN|nr:hypothetical protein [Nocardioides jejuensis]TCJ28577.1 hypothetical protein EPD65_07655 [Nocardioides jejuensis]